MTTLRRILIPLAFLTSVLGLVVVQPPAAAEPAAPAQLQACNTISFYNSYLSDRGIQLRKADNGTYTVPIDRTARNHWRKLINVVGKDVYLDSSVPSDNGVVLRDAKEYTITRWHCGTTATFWAQIAPNGWFDNPDNLRDARWAARSALAPLPPAESSPAAISPNGIEICNAATSQNVGIRPFRDSLTEGRVWYDELYRGQCDEGYNGGGVLRVLLYAQVESYKSGISGQGYSACQNWPGGSTWQVSNPPEAANGRRFIYDVSLWDDCR
jgi:hypothetical protein